jgi:plastocyanin
MGAFHKVAARRVALPALIKCAAPTRIGLAVLLFCLAAPFMAEGVTVTILVGPNGQLGFSPNNVTIHAGDSVYWDFSQAGFNPHVVFSSSAGNCIPDQSPLFAGSSSFSYTFTQPGTYPYMCIIDSHCPAGENGVVTVLPTSTGVNHGLTIQQTGANQYIISWNAFLSQGLGLRSATDLTNPMWQTVPITPTTVGNRRQVVLTASSPDFFRLDCTADGNQDQPDDNFVDNDCDGIDGNIASAIFVSPYGNDANPGTPGQPVLTIAQGLSNAQAAGKTQVYVAAGTYSVTTLNLVDGIWIFGAYSPYDWSRSDSNITEIDSTSSIAIAANNFTQTLVLDHLKIVSASATSNGGSSYGIFLNNASTVVVHGCTIIAGNGANGVAGSNGSNGATGVSDPNQNGGNGCSSCNFGSCFQPTPGDPGQAALGPCFGRNGGAGGNAGFGAASNGSDAGAGFGHGQCPGGSGCGGAGGAGGGTAIDSPSGVDGGNGVAGANGAAGSDGSSGQENYLSTGYSGISGGNGTDGSGGGAGGGGGGGGGVSQINGCQWYGGAGGGGGGAGCGGKGGSGGISGGASIGIYAWQTTLFVNASAITTAGGGNGGNGGTGGSGGAGGTGGNGGQRQADIQFAPHVSGAGGRGGAGGNGANGGSAGGGPGGPSIGVLFGNTFAISPQGTSFTIGGAGGGGLPNGFGGRSQATFSWP